MATKEAEKAASIGCIVRGPLRRFPRAAYTAEHLECIEIAVCRCVGERCAGWKPAAKRRQRGLGSLQQYLPMGVVQERPGKDTKRPRVATSTEAGSISPTEPELRNPSEQTIASRVNKRGQSTHP